MSTHQAKLLLELASEIKSKGKKRTEIVASLTAAKILTKDEKFTNHYPQLKKALAAAE